MNAIDINRFPIREYLAGLDIYPAKDRGYYGMYHSPFREDTNASMKVDYNKNLWIDFGSNEGGTLIDLVMRIENCSVRDAISILQDRYADMQPVGYPANQLSGQSDSKSFSFHQQEKALNINIVKISELNHPALLDYLKKRCVNTDIARLYCKEIHYTVNDKGYFAVGFQNDNKGWVLRSEPFKGCTSMDVRTFHSNPDKEACLVFEGFMDYLSYLTLKNIQALKQNIVILNSVINLPKAIEFIRQHPKIYTYMDNDDSGRKTTKEIKKVCKTVFDQSANYTQSKDLNDYLVSTKKLQQDKQGMRQQPVQRKPSQGFRM